jgi:hypothetical protein
MAVADGRPDEPETNQTERTGVSLGLGQIHNISHMHTRVLGTVLSKLYTDSTTSTAQHNTHGKRKAGRWKDGRKWNEGGEKEE